MDQRLALQNKLKLELQTDINIPGSVPGWDWHLFEPEGWDTGFYAAHHLQLLMTMRQESDRA